MFRAHIIVYSKHGTRYAKSIIQNSDITMLLVFHDQKQTKIAGDGLMTPYLAASHSIGFLEEMCGAHFHWNGEIPNMKVEQKSKIWSSLPVINILTCLKNMLVV